jgi:APA family basic amino acid/polyamine antiporter
LIPYTPENPDRLIKYAIRVAKENNGEINILRVITVPHQTPLSAGTAFTERASKAFEPLENMIDKENILNHYFVRISHDANEAILSTIAEQKIDLLITDYETLRRNKALQTLATCNMLAILTGGISDEELAFEYSVTKENEYQGLEENDLRNRKKSLVVLYDGGDHSDMVLRTASWLEHSRRFKTTILSIKKKEEGKHISYSRIDDQDIKYKKDKDKEKHMKYLEQIGVEFREVFVTDSIRNNSQEFCQLILSSINASQPDLLVTGKRIGKFSVFDNEHFVSLLGRLNCPVIVARSFVIPGLSKMRSSLMKAIHHS